MFRVYCISVQAQSPIMGAHFPLWVVWGRMRWFNYIVATRISYMPVGPCGPQKDRRYESRFVLSQTKLIIQLSFSEWLHCPDNFRAIHNRLPSWDNKRGHTINTSLSRQQKTSLTSEKVSADFTLFLQVSWLSASSVLNAWRNGESDELKVI